MNAINWNQLLLQFGGFAFLALFFWLFLRADFKRREKRDEEYDKLVKAFIETSNAFGKTSADFAVVVGNETAHHTEAIEALTKAVERLCIYIEVDKR